MRGIWRSMRNYYPNHITEILKNNDYVKIL